MYEVIITSSVHMESGRQIMVCGEFPWNKQTSTTYGGYYWGGRGVYSRFQSQGEHGSHFAGMSVEQPGKPGTPGRCVKSP